MGDLEDNNNYRDNNNDATALQRDESTETPVQNFYAGQSIFITGGTGFLGKILVEKLLRSCPGISTIYLLVRPKKGKDADRRFGELFEDRVFDRLRKVMPNFRDKIVRVNGDCCVEGLALAHEDTQLLMREVSIVFHVAATVRFDEELKLALRINVQGTREVLALCERMSNLKALLHVSTAYANCHLKEIDEKFYDYPIGYKELLELSESLPQVEFEQRTSKYVQAWPNTYTITKAIAESLIREEYHNLPVGIFRPAIVISTCEEPVPGWIDNLYGPTGLLAAAMTGLLQFIYCNPQANADLVPVDLTVNALIVSAYDVYCQRQRRNKAIPIYNYISTVEAPLNWGHFQQWSTQATSKYPLNSAIWYCSSVLVKNKILYTVASLLCHFLPALILDFVSLCIGRQPRMWKTYSKIHKFSMALAPFSLNEWIFSNENVRAMWQRSSEKDKAIFPFSMKGLSWKKYFDQYVMGVRTFVMKEDPSTIPSAKAKMHRLFWMHNALKCLLLVGAFSMVRKVMAMISH